MGNDIDVLREMLDRAGIAYLVSDRIVKAADDIVTTYLTTITVRPLDPRIHMAVVFRFDGANLESVAAKL